MTDKTVPKTQISTEQQLELDATAILRGAEEVKRRLYVEMTAGNPSISDLSYAIKIRIKEDYKIIDKILKKRKTKKYNASDIRDVIGLRVVTLYRLDSIEIMPILFDKIRIGMNNSDSVFSTKGVEEIIIYSTNPTGDAQDLPGRIKAICQAFDFGDRTKIEQTPQNYTSIHIVIWCRGVYRNSYKEIPVEIQIRTAFEDVWGEIDHSLKYKKSDKATEASANIEMSSSHLNVMKTFVDALAQYGDQIKIQSEFSNKKLIKGSLHFKDDKLIDRIQEIDGISQPIKNISRDISRMLDKIRGGARNILSQEKILIECRKAVAEVIRAKEKLKSENIGENEKLEANFLFDMEHALLLFEIGNNLGSIYGNHSLVEASRLYSKICTEFPDRPLPLYRYARTLDELGDRPAAKSKFEAAQTAILKSDLDEKHWLRTATPRVIACFLWEEGCINISSADPEKKNISLSKLLEAISINSQAMKTEDETDKLKAENNLICFMLDYLKNSGDEEELKKLGYTKEDLSDLVTKLEHRAIDPRSWDTVMQAWNYLEEHDKAAAAAQKLKTLLADPSRKERIASESDILDLIEKILSQAESKNGS